MTHPPGGHMPPDNLTDEVAQTRYKHEIKPMMDFVASKLSEIYDLPDGMHLEWVDDEQAPR